MTRALPILATSKTAAKLLDMQERDFLSLVQAGALPQPRDISGHQRWDIEELRTIGRGETAFGMSGVSW
jgi:hypothetical protein